MLAGKQLLLDELSSDLQRELNDLKRKGEVICVQGVKKKNSKYMCQRCGNVDQRLFASFLCTGDLVFLQGTYREGVSHVGIYIGGGQIIHAADESTGVTYGSVNSSYNQKHFLGYGRL